MLGNDVHRVSSGQLAECGRIDILIITTDCGVWSSLLEKSEGFGRKEMSAGGKLFVKCAELKDELLAMNPAMKSRCETNCVSDQKGEQWKEDEEIQQETVMGVHFQLVSALSIGSSVSRFRRFGSNSEMKYDFTEPGDPDDSLDLWWTSEKSLLLV